MSSQLFDLAVVGGGVIGLAHAFTAAKAGKRVAVIERDARANGASLRNFGFISRRVASRVKWCRGRGGGRKIKAGDCGMGLLYLSARCHFPHSFDLALSKSDNFFVQINRRIGVTHYKFHAVANAGLITGGLQFQLGMFGG